MGKPLIRPDNVDAKLNWRKKMWMEKPGSVLTVAVAALIFGATLITVGLNALSWAIG